MTANTSTLFLRLEGPLQAWGDASKFVIRRSMDAPTKSGVLGLICCAMGLSRRAARERLSELSTLAMGVRIDRAGTRWWDWHTVGAKVGILNAKGEVKKTATTGEYETLVTRREYLADASFLVALQGKLALISDVAGALSNPAWPVFLGRKSCPPSVPVFAWGREGEPSTNPAGHNGLTEALTAAPWRARYDGDAPRDQRGHPRTTIELPCVVEWRAAGEGDTAPDDAEVWYDAPVSFDPPVHHPRLVVRRQTTVEVADALQQTTAPPPRPRADYQSTEYRKAREARLRADYRLCVFCKSAGPRMTVQHVTYRRAGGKEIPEDLRSLCGLCHDAVTMIEYGLGMGLDRINPEDPQWREQIIGKREEIIRFRSLEMRRRRLAAEEVE